MKVEIKKTAKSSVINYGKPQLLISEISQNIVLSNGNHKHDEFEGTLLYTKDKTEKLRFSNYWNKSNFKLFIGELTISND